MTPKDCTVMVIDNGLFAELAMVLARTFKRVRYHVPYSTQFPKRNHADIGRGYGDIEHVYDMWPHVADTDLFVFPDVGFPGLQDHLASIGKMIFGPRGGEALEQDREALKKLMESRGLPVGPYEVVKGLDALRDALKDKRGTCYVKIDQWRGYMETFRCDGYRFVEPLLDELQHDMGRFKDSMTFIIEDALPDKVELGIDAYNIDGRMPDKALIGLEVKDLGYVGCVHDYAAIPEPLTRFDRIMAPELRKAHYRGFYSTEVRIGKDMTPYMIDLCARCGSPPSELYQELYSNIADIVFYGAQGRVVQPTVRGKYGCEVILKCTDAKESFIPVLVPKSVAANVKLHNATKISGVDYVIPQSVGMVEIGAAVGWGSTLKTAMDMALDAAGEVRCRGLEIPKSALDKAQEQIQEAQGNGLHIF